MLLVRSAFFVRLIKVTGRVRQSASCIGTKSGGGGINMPTRHADGSSDRAAQERFISSTEYVSRRGILANAVAAKAQLYRSAVHRSLLLFLQGLSMTDGGLNALAGDLFDMFPDRVLEQIKTADFEVFG